MKRIFIIIFILNNLYSNNDLNTTSLDMFLFKIGFTSLIGEVKTNKNISDENRVLLKKLEKQIQTMRDINSKSVLSNSLSLNKDKTVDTKNTDVKLLTDKIRYLEKRLDEILIKKVIPYNHDKNIKSAIVAISKAFTYTNQDFKSQIAFEVQRNDILKIEYCTKYSWCKVYKRDAFIAQYKIKFIKNN
jgi:hypothetical protein